MEYNTGGIHVRWMKENLRNQILPMFFQKEQKEEINSNVCVLKKKDTSSERIGELNGNYRSRKKRKWPTENT